jgi:hypothetical protein
MTRAVHLIGEIPLPDTREVFLTISRTLGRSVSAYPDGRIASETDWEAWLADAILQIHRGSSVHSEAASLPYARDAHAAYDIFKALKSEGEIPVGRRMQVHFVPAVLYLWPGLDQRERRTVDEMFNAALKAELAAVAAYIPSGELTVQAEVSVPHLMDLTQRYTSPEREVILREAVTAVAQLVDGLPVDVEVRIHLCALDGARYQMRPDDLEIMVRFANELADACCPIRLIHMPVPLVHEDDSFFRGLRNLALPPDTELCLGLVHLSDGLEGALRRIALARLHADGFAIAARCGLAARPPEAIPGFLALQAEVAACA